VRVTLNRLKVAVASAVVCPGGEEGDPPPQAEVSPSRAFAAAGNAAVAVRQKLIVFRAAQLLEGGGRAERHSSLYIVFWHAC